MISGRQGVQFLLIATSFITVGQNTSPLREEMIANNLLSERK
jgi:hypothetical protein